MGSSEIASRPMVRYSVMRACVSTQAKIEAAATMNSTAAVVSTVSSDTRMNRFQFSER